MKARELIRSEGALARFADKKGFRGDWHEPDEQGLVRAWVDGQRLDNANPGSEEETHLFLLMDDGERVAINLCDLLAWASAGRREQ